MSLDGDEVGEITALARDADRPVEPEDPFSATDLTHLGPRNWQMPVVWRAPGPVAPPALDVVLARDADSLAAAERQIVGGVTFDIAGARIATVRGIADSARLVRLGDVLRQQEPGAPLSTRW